MRHDNLVKAENPEGVSDELRTSDEPMMRRRRQVGCPSTFAVIPAVLPELRAAVRTIRRHPSTAQVRV